jgi:hypothetical protein
MSYFMLPIGFLASAFVAISRVLISGLGLFQGNINDAVESATNYFDAPLKEVRDV